MNPLQRRQPALDQHGFTLVELMVALVIGSLIAVAAASLAFSFDASRKTTLAANNATGAGAAALAALYTQVAMSGGGLISNGEQFCQTLHVSTAATPLPLDPLAIDHASRPDTDVLQFAYAAGGSAAALLPIPGVLASLVADIPVSAVGAVRAGNQVLLTRDTNGTLACVLRRVTSLNTAAGIDTLHFSATDALNGAVGALLSFGSTSFVVPVAELRMQRWYAQDGVLRQQDVLKGTVADVADGVLYLRAQYGIDTGTGIAWQDVAPAAPSLNRAQLAGLRSVRIALLARTSDREHQADPARCTTTTDPAIPLGNGWALSVNVANLKNSAGAALVPDWQCYSYRSYSTVQPLRNVIWGTPT